MSHFVISSGGTGGHLAPGIALAEELMARGHGCVLLVSAKKVDARLLEKYPNIRFVCSPGVGFEWGFIATPKFVLGQLSALWFALRLVRREKPAAVVGFGGFTTVGLSIAARIMGVPIFLHEANRVIGRAIRLLSGIATCVYVPEGVPLGGLPPETLRECGFPLRREMKRLPRSLAREKLGIATEGKLLLILGGSQGAASFNRWISANFNRLAEEGISVYCVMGLGKGGQGVIEKRNPDGQVTRAYFTNFCDDMPALLSSADLVLSRAGAGSIAEFVRFRLPSLLVPYPQAADDHQTANARFLERQGGCVVVGASQQERLFREVLDLIFNDWLLGEIRANLDRLDSNAAVKRMAEDLEACARAKQK